MLRVRVPLATPSFPRLFFCKSVSRDQFKLVHYFYSDPKTVEKFRRALGFKPKSAGPKGSTFVGAAPVLPRRQQQGCEFGQRLDIGQMISATETLAPLAEVKNKLSEYAERAAQGEVFVITKHGDPVAKLVRAKEPKQRTTPMEAAADIRALRATMPKGIKWADLKAWKDAGRP